MAGSTPYFIFGAQRRYPFAWHGGAGGVPQQNIRSAEAAELSDFDLAESGLEASYSPFALPYAALRRTRLHDHRGMGGMGDWPLYRQAGLEPLDPNQLGFFDNLSGNEQKLAKLAVAGAVLYVVAKKMGVLKKRRR